MVDFNPISRIYDLLKSLIFGRSLEKATMHFLEFVPSNSKILIIGGGTGKLLRNFNSTHQIQYVELSSAMISKAKKVNSNALIEFIHADILKWNSDEKFDFIITPFILDCFNDDTLNFLLPKLKNNLNHNGSWIHIDFYPKNAFQKSLVSIMYFFFRMTAKLEVKELADFDHLFKNHEFICKRKALFFHSMVESKIYRKIDG